MLIEGTKRNTLEGRSSKSRVVFGDVLKLKIGDAVGLESSLALLPQPRAVSVAGAGGWTPPSAPTVNVPQTASPPAPPINSSHQQQQSRPTAVVESYSYRRHNQTRWRRPRSITSSTTRLRTTRSRRTTRPSPLPATPPSSSTAAPAMPSSCRTSSRATTRP